MPLILTTPYRAVVRAIKTSILLRLNGLKVSAVQEEAQSKNIPSPNKVTKIAVTTENPQSGTKSLSFEGRRDGLITTATAPFAFSGNFTLEFFFAPNRSRGAPIIDVSGIVDISWQSLSLDTDVDDFLYMYAFSHPYTGGTSSSTTICNGLKASKRFKVKEFNHVAIQRDGNLYTLMLNGERVASVISSLTPYAPIHGTVLGSYPINNLTTFNHEVSPAFDGFIDNLRVTKGVARYPGTTYIVPVTPFGNTVETDSHWNNVSLLLDMETVDASGAPIDAKGSQFTLQREVDQQYTFSTSHGTPFGSGEAFAVESSGDLLVQEIGYEIGLDDFTAEIWSLVTSTTPTYKTIFGNRRGTIPTKTGFSVGINGSRVYAYSDNFIVAETGTIPTNTWFHVAFVRKNGVFTLYLNGQPVGSKSVEYNLTDKVFSLGANTDGTQSAKYVTTRLSQFRLSRYARYEASFTPLQAPAVVD